MSKRLSRLSLRLRQIIHKSKPKSFSRNQLKAVTAEESQSLKKAALQPLSCWNKSLIVLIISLLPLILVVILSRRDNIPIRYLTADLVATLEQPFYLGFLSQLGILLWSAIATICLITATVLQDRSGSSDTYHFFAWSGYLTLWLGLDDVFLLHENFLPFYVGIPEKAVYMFYFGFLVIYLWKFKGFIRHTNPIFFGIALICFGLSISLDTLNPPYIDPYLFEDGFKFLGLVAWLTYFWQTALGLLRRDPRLS